MRVHTCIFYFVSDLFFDTCFIVICPSTRDVLANFEKKGVARAQDPLFFISINSPLSFKSYII